MQHCLGNACLSEWWPCPTGCILTQTERLSQGGEHLLEGIGTGAALLIKSRGWPGHFWHVFVGWLPRRSRGFSNFVQVTDHNQSCFGGLKHTPRAVLLGRWGSWAPGGWPHLHRPWRFFGAAHNPQQPGEILVVSSVPDPCCC